MHKAERVVKFWPDVTGIIIGVALNIVVLHELYTRLDWVVASIVGWLWVGASLQSYLKARRHL